MYHNYNCNISVWPFMLVLDVMQIWQYWCYFLYLIQTKVLYYILHKIIDRLYIVHSCLLRLSHLFAFVVYAYFTSYATVITKIKTYQFQMHLQYNDLVKYFIVRFTFSLRNFTMHSCMFVGQDQMFVDSTFYILLRNVSINSCMFVGQDQMLVGQPNNSFTNNKFDDVAWCPYLQ